MAKDKKAEAAAAAAAGDAKTDKPAAAPAPPREPVDPRLKFYKKFQGRFLPKGPLRERLKAMETRWASDANHGDVTVEELRTLLADWRASRENPKKRPVKA